MQGFAPPSHPLGSKGWKPYLRSNFMFKKVRGKLEKAMFDYVDNNLLPITYEIALDVAKSGLILGYEDYCMAVRNRLRGQDLVPYE